VVNREQQTGSAQTRIALGVQLSPRRPFLECQPGKRRLGSPPGPSVLTSACLRASGKSTAFRHCLVDG
jgi:hypothetical protein